MKFLWALFIVGQILSAGNMNYQQEAGYHEINPIYGRHPDKMRVYATKAVGIVGIYALTRAWPRHEKKMLVGANGICWGFIIYDKAKGVAFSLRF